jgi:hypothetical protein
MIGDGIAVTAAIYDNWKTMSTPCPPSVQESGEVGLALCEAAALARRSEAMLALLSSRLGAFADDPADPRRVAAHELEQLNAIGGEVAELASQIALILEGLPLEPVAATERALAQAARAALADGILDHRRAVTAAGLLSAAQGFPALAEALADCDAHAYWSARVVDVLGAFRDVDSGRARQTAALAGIDATARFCELAPERVVELTQTLRRLASR